MSTSTVVSESVPGKLLALDMGLASIGVAVCDPLRLAARPLTVIQRASRRDDFAILARIVREEEVVAVVCGLPLNMDNSEGDQARTTRKWAMRLAHALRTLLGKPYPILFWDERLTTQRAQEIMAENRREQRASVHSNSVHNEDAIAAAVILQSYLDAQRRNSPTDYGRIDLPPQTD